MVFTDIRLQNFRSYTDSSFDLSDSVTIVVGPNTAGKTNLLEAILFVSQGKSYRVPGVQLIKDGSQWSRVDIHTSGNKLRTVKITKDNETITKSFEIDGKEYKRLPLGAQQPTVLFEPNNLLLLEGSPTRRREYIDNIISQTTPGYTKILSDYKRSLAQRNALLKSGRNTEEIFVWNIKLSQLGGQIAEERNKLVDEINETLEKTYKKIAGSKKTLQIIYSSATSRDNYGTKLLSQLEKNIMEDSRKGFTGYGPHRDDIEFLFGGKPATSCASRGEMRTILLALKAIELGMLERARGIKPILLLDDVFSELDGSRRKALTELVKDHQTIITTTDADIVTKNFSQNCQIIPLST